MHDPTAPFSGITVTGRGSARTAPDLADWSFGVQSDAATAAEALRANSASMEQLLAALRGAGIRAEDLRTERVSVYPRTGADGVRVEAFQASNTVHAVVRELADAGPVVDAAVQGGASSVSGPVFRLADPRPHYEAAVEAAFEDARFRAEAIAARAGIALGEPVAIVEGGGAVPLPRGPAFQSAQAVSVPLEPGLQEVTVVLTVTFAAS